LIPRGIDPYGILSTGIDLRGIDHMSMCPTRRCLGLIPQGIDLYRGIAPTGHWLSREFHMRAIHLLMKLPGMNCSIFEPPL